MFYPNHIEDICYEMKHINEVLKEIRQNIPEYFQKYLETEGGQITTEEDVKVLAQTFGASSTPKAKKKNYTKVLQRLQQEAIDDFEGDRDKYVEIFDLEMLSEYGEDVGAFKDSILRKEVPIIRKTLQNKSAKELDRYRMEFNTANSGHLHKVCTKLTELANEWKDDWYDSKEFEAISHIDDMGYYDLDEEECVVYGVIGGGIKSTFLYKLYPCMFPFRSREGIWALWYLSGKKRFGCTEDSEFLMINTEKSTTQQNYFYPYALFSYYALQIFLELKQLFAKHNVEIPTEYRFVVVESFLSFVGISHADETSLLKQDNSNYQYDY